MKRSVLTLSLTVPLAFAATFMGAPVAQAAVPVAPVATIAPLLIDPIASQTVMVGSPIARRTVGSNDSAAKVTVTGLPAGVSFDPVSWNITGTPTVPGTYLVKATVTDRFGRSVSTTFTITVKGAPVPGPLLIDPIASQTVTAGQPIARRTVGSNDPAAKVTVTGLPAGVSFDPVSWNITGTPTVPGTYAVKATVLDRFGRSVSTWFTITVKPAV
ncbi:Ig domain-containing protein [Mariniluteicoccus flavus]